MRDKATMSNQPYSRIITVTGHGNVEAPADRVILGFNVESKMRSYAETVALLNEKTGKLRTAIETLGIQPSSLKTTSFNISPNYDYINNRRVFTGFSAKHGLKLELPFDKERINAVIDGLAASGSETEFRITFTVEDTEELRKRALQAAVADATRKAEIIAEAAGKQLGDILRIDFSRILIEFDAPSFSSDTMAESSLLASAPDIEPEDVSSETSITMVWEITGK